MSATYPNPFDAPEAWGFPKIGGIEPLAILTEVDGFKTVWEWKEQKAKGKDGADFTYGGQKPLGDMELTFISTTSEAAEQIKALRGILEPKPGLSGSASSSSSGASGPPTFTIGASSSSSSSGSSSGSSSSGSSSGTTATASGSSTSSSSSSSTSTDSKTPDPGPKPPTVTLDLGQAAAHGVFAVSLKEWDGPKILANGSVQDKIKFIQAKAPTPAGVSVQPAKQPDAFAAGGGNGAARPQDGANKPEKSES